MNKGKPFIQIRQGECRWPLWVAKPDYASEATCCGDAVKQGSIYCPSHYAQSVGHGTPSERQALKAALKMVRRERSVFEE